MDISVYSLQGKEVKKIQLNDEVFNREVSEGSIYNAIKNENANMRIGTASTKTRSEVVGSSKKPWRQKGTGRARSGTKQSPVWVGGGIAFGPRPRDFSYSIPKKMKRLAYKSIFSKKLKDEALTVVEDFAVESGKTKDMVSAISKLSDSKRTVIIIPENDQLTKRASANVPWLTVFTYDKLRAHDLFYGEKIIIQESAALKLNDFYAGNKG